MRPERIGVARQAQAAGRRRGRRYEVPRVAREDLTGTAGFQRGIARLAAELGRDEPALRAEVDDTCCSAA